ncbi:MAG: hypothetical protein ACREOG_18575 [Gemmatimonadaceae bacterium]
MRRYSQLAAFVLFAGCGLFDESDAEVVLSASAAATVRIGDSVAVTVTIENRSNEPITYQGNLCPRVFRVLSSSGEHAGPPFQTITCLAVHIPVQLAAGERHQFVRYWQARTHGPRFEPIVIQPGRYRIEPSIGVGQMAGGRRVDVRYVVSTIIVIE